MLFASFLVAALTLTYVLGSNPNRGLGRFLAPDSMATIMLIAIFTIRPVFTNRFDEAAWYGLYLPDQAEESLALGVGMTCLVGLLLGVFLARLRPTKLQALENRSAGPRSYDGWSFSRGKLVFATVAGLGAYIALLMAVAGADVIRQLAGGRSSEVALAGVPEIVMMIPLAGSIAAAIFILGAKDRQLVFFDLALIIGSTAASILMVSQLGTRRFIIPAMLLPVLAALIRKPVRVKAGHVIIGAVAILFLAIVPMVRAAGARRVGENLATASWRYLQEEGIGGVLRPVFASYDTEMFDYIAVASRGLSGDQYGLGRGTLLEFFTRPIPSFTRIGELTGVPFSDQMITRLFGGGCGEPFCPVASVAGVLYFDGGFILVFLGSIAFGAGMRAIANRWVYNRGLSPFQMFAVVSVSSFALVAARTNTIHTMWWCIYTLIIGCAIIKVLNARRNASIPAELQSRPGKEYDLTPGRTRT